ncbi:MAG: Uncharacterised protein [Cryomorphaceae bacterium]|nr:MAG: Uncharacterised protein [Cryomorphaceae bacterium]
MSPAPHHVLHVAKWYPNPKDVQHGIFVKKQIDALSVEQHTLAFVNEHFPPIHEPQLSLYGAQKMSWSVKLATFIGTLSKAPYTIVHFHCFTPDLLPMAIYARQKGLKIAYTEHFSGYLPENLDRLSSLKNWATRQFLKRVDIAFPVSPVLASALHTLYSSLPTQLVPNIVSDAPAVARKNEGTTAVKFLMVADIVFEIKRQDLVLKLFQNLPRMRAELHFIGGGPDQERLKDLASRAPNVYMHGRKSNEEVLEMLPEFDVHILYSAYESFGITTFEARKAGLWAITRASFGGSHWADEYCLMAENDEHLLTTMNDLLHGERPSANSFHELSATAVGQQINSCYNEL